EHRAQREIAEHVEGADVLGEKLGQPQQHQCVPFGGDFPQSAATTRSMRMKREPLTSTVVPALTVAARCPASASTDAKCIASGPKAAALSRASSPTVNRRSIARS